MFQEKCMVCNRTTSLGNDYGVFTCSDCSLFYKKRYTGSLPIQPCRYEKKCRVSYKEPFCHHCRLRKCIALGMIAPDSPPAAGIEEIKATFGKNDFDLFSTWNTDLTMMSSILQAQKNSYDESTLKDIIDRDPIRNSDSRLCCPFNNEQNVTSTKDSSKLNALFDQSIAGVVKFANGIPGFRELLTVRDQRVLLRYGLFQVLFLRLLPLFGNGGLKCLSGHVVSRDVRTDVGYVQRMFEIADKLIALRPSQTKMALFSAVLLINVRRPELTNKNTVSYLQERVKRCLCMLNYKTQSDITDLLGMIGELDYLSIEHERCRFKKSVPSHPHCGR